ncbi:uncharacterized protein LOC117784406 [Drosophila innubila]|uniref:uncharacterized protein LOC117784406 n=1 Tax=Drosophila innubila TaxID=198719 RepID=UPI00148D6E89|nr:uncharacterized protein LOC117784406 [Drosophila innubila]
MYSNKVRSFTKLTTSLIRLPELVPKYQFSSFNRYYSKACKYYGGFTAPVSERSDAQKQRKQKPIIDCQGSLVEKWKYFKTQLTNFEDPLKKYDHLMSLRDQDLDLYYHFLRDYTGEVLAILYAVDGVIRNFERFEIHLPNMPTLMKQRKKRPAKPLDIANAVEYLRKRINDLRKANSKNEGGSGSKSKSEEKINPIKWIKKRFMLTPNTCCMAYLKTNNLK